MKKHDALSNICSTREASEMLGVSQRTVQLWVESGVLKAWKTPGGHRKISLSSVNQIIEKRQISIEMQRFISNAEFNILYIKDQVTPFNLIQNYFSWALNKVKVELMPNAFDGIVSLSRNKPDLLIVDVEKEDVDCIGLIKYMKNNQEFNSIEIAAFTSMPASLLIDYVGTNLNIEVFEKPISLMHLENYVGLLALRKKYK